VREPSPV